MVEKLCDEQTTVWRLMEDVHSRYMIACASMSIRAWMQDVHFCCAIAKQVPVQSHICHHVHMHHIVSSQWCKLIWFERTTVPLTSSVGLCAETVHVCGFVK